MGKDFKTVRRENKKRKTLLGEGGYQTFTEQIIPAFFQLFQNTKLETTPPDSCFTSFNNLEAKTQINLKFAYQTSTLKRLIILLKQPTEF